MNGVDPTAHLWWLASRSAGILALVAMSYSVIIGLLLGGKLISKSPTDSQGRKFFTPLIVARSHEQASLLALFAIAAHGLLLLGDAYLRPTLTDIAVPFAIAYRPTFTGIGIIGGYLAALFGMAYYARNWIGKTRWRNVHRMTIVAFAMSVVHTLGAGTDAGQAWLFWPIMAVCGVVIALLATRIISARTSSPQRRSEAPSLSASRIASKKRKGSQVTTI